MDFETFTYLGYYFGYTVIFLLETFLYNFLINDRNYIIYDQLQISCKKGEVADFEVKLTYKSAAEAKWI